MTMRKRLHRLLIRGCSLLLILGMSQLEASAQVHRIEIDQGRVLIDGRELPAAALPESFDVESVRASFLLEQGMPAFLTVDGLLFQVSSEGIQQVGPAHRLLAPRGSAAPSEQGIPIRLASDEVRQSHSDISMIEQAEVLRERARELQKMTFELQQTRMQSNQLFDMIESIQRSAAETERVARSLPHLQAQRYMHEMRERNSELYDRLLREQTLERETLQLSSRIRLLDDGAERTELIARLRSLLEESLQMKQDNRRQEIAELEERLSSLQRRLEKRERHFDHIVDRRLEQLIQPNEDQP